MRIWAWVRRYRWSLLIVLAATALWWPALDYLADFRKPDVPYLPTPHAVVAAMLDLAEVTDRDTVYDLGSGDGRVLLAAARDRGAHAVGIEIDTELVEKSRAAIREVCVADRVTVRRGDIFKQDLSPATVITMYLKPLVNVRLRPQPDRLRPGTRIVSHMFSMPGARPSKVVKVRPAPGAMEHRLYLWVAPIQWA
jgi:SAM-dependent methyltransferase